MKRILLASVLLVSSSGCATIVGGLFESLLDSASDRPPPPTSYEGRLRAKIGAEEYKQLEAERGYRWNALNRK